MLVDSNRTAIKPDRRDRKRNVIIKVRPLKPSGTRRPALARQDTRVA
ncbi:hypothetical protein [Sphingomonas sp. NFR15]|nr:hypothetical protein [Sphingomonas sp. NFR15]